ncbi:MAG: glycosyltransferase family 1 protein, partial [Phycisphaerae bacterium]
VHACVSWYETPGLASLEAALSGCNLVVTPGGSTREYFGNQAYYCEPDNPGSIRAAVEAALAAAPDPELACRIAREFNWDAAAKNTLRGYQLALRTAQR